MKFKQNPVCQECGLGWCDNVFVKGVEYLKCRSCGHMRKVSKKSITPVGKHEEKGE